LRWIAVLLIGAPTAMLLLAWIGGQSAFSRNLLRGLRPLLAVEIGVLLVAAVFGASYEVLSRNREQALYKPHGQLVDVGGYRLHLYCTGQGSPTVVLDFGVDGSYLEWRYVQPGVSQFARVCSYDRGGYGFSDPSPKPRVPSAMAEELRELLRRAGERPPFIIVGHSFGAQNAIMFAHRHPEEVEGIVLVDGTHPDYKIPFGWTKKLQLRMMQFTVPFGLPRWRGWCGGGTPDIAGIKAAVTCRSRVWRTNYEQLAAYPTSAAEVKQIQDLGDLPLIVISRDPGRNPQEREAEWQKLQVRLARLSTNSRYVIAQGSGHNVPTAAPEVIVNEIRKLLDARRSKQ
jgi:pimeloyl-ACP methyl ester carboxylesterase